MSGNPCAADYLAVGGRCVGNLLSLAGVDLDPDAIEDSRHVGTHLFGFVSNSKGTAFANLIFDLGTQGAADAIVLWQFTGNKLDTQVRDYQIRTSNTLASAQALANPVTVASGTLPQGSTDNSGQRIDGLALGRYVQIAGLSNYGSTSAHGLGGTAFLRTLGAPEQPANQPPVLEAPADRTGNVGRFVSFAFQATDPDGDRLTFAAPGLPTGITLDPNTGIASGTLAAEGVFSTTVSVSDGRGGLDEAPFQWTVEPALPADIWINGQVSTIYARGNPCGADYLLLNARCAGWLLVQDGLTFDPAVIEDSVHVGKHLKSFVSSSSGTPLANLIFDLGASDAADTIILWQYIGSKLDSQIRDYTIRTSDSLGADGQSLVNPITVASGTLTQGSVDNSGQRIDGLALGRYVQIVGTSNYGSTSSNGLGKVGFITH